MTKHILFITWHTLEHIFSKCPNHIVTLIHSNLDLKFLKTYAWHSAVDLRYRVNKPMDPHPYGLNPAESEPECKPAIPEEHIIADLRQLLFGYTPNMVNLIRSEPDLEAGFLKLLYAHVDIAASKLARQLDERNGFPGHQCENQEQPHKLSAQTPDPPLFSSTPTLVVSLT
jgi:hypothetical protein